MLPNKLIRFYLFALEDLLGMNGVNAILNLAGHRSWAENYPPDDDLHAIPYESLSSIQSSIEDIYGDRAGQNLSRQAAHSSFLKTAFSLMEPGTLNSIGGDKPQEIKRALNNFITIFDPESTGSISWAGAGEQLEIRFETCPNCTGREAPTPICKACAGWIEALFDAFEIGERIRVIETSCCAKGDEACVFLVQSG